ncbi:MAG: NAD-dependent epimerase/dehydratase family protein [Gammaproteobacteria bacterium]|jgi:nucleoside-diphosphate-sugar epimerase
MKILVTGGTGFTGAALTLRLLDDGHSVSVIDKDPGIALEEIKQKGAQVVLGSITDRDLVAKCVSGAEIVMHLAAAFREIGVPDALYQEVNVEGTRIVVEEALKAGARKLVYCSTQGVHGHIETPPGDESSPIAPADYYQQTKYEGELVVQEYAKQGIEHVILRPTAIYGPGDPGRFLMIYKRVKKGTFPMFGRGKTFYHPLYIDNLVDAFILAMAPGAGAGKAYIIGDEEFFSIEELVSRVGKAIDVDVSIPHFPILPLIVAGHVCEKACKPFGITPPIFPRRVDWFRQVRAFKIDKAKKELGYKPRIGIDDGLRRTGEWYRKKGYL